MKKIIAVVLAVVMALSCSAIAFAETLKCPYCSAEFTSETEYNKHITTCYNQHTTQANTFLDLTAVDLAEKILAFFQADTDFLAVVQDTIIRLIDLIENIGAAAASESDVAGAVDDLEEKVASLPLVGDALEYVHNLINTLKQKIKDLYASDAETAAEEPASTGSTSVGVVAFAAVSVAAAAAFVCTRKKEN